MTFEVSKPRSPSLPDVFNGEIYRQVGKYARSAVLYAFEEMGGPQALAKWGEENKDEFYTKLFPKVIARESEVQHVRGVDDLMDLLDADYEVIEDAEVVDAPYEPSPQFQNHGTVDPEWDEVSQEDLALLVEGYGG